MKRSITRLAGLLLATSVLAGCAGATRLATDTLAAGVGGVAGNVLSKGNPIATGAGAAGGVLLSESLNAASSANARKAMLEGYNKGRSDAVKQQYWIMQNQQRSMLDSQEDVSLFDIPLPEQEIDGALLKPRTATLRLRE
ncbi:MAG: hypothetical protein ABI680_00245 [Chthoniobacteraceae bacterium]